MNHAILVTWESSTGKKLWHICRGYTDYDAFTAYTMFCARQDDEEFFSSHTKVTLGIQVL